MAEISKARQDFDATGAILDNIGGQCPVQAEGSIDGERFYFRARGQSWSFTIAKTDAEMFTDETFMCGAPWGDPFEAGYMPEDTALGFMLESVEMFRAEKRDQSNDG